MRKFLPYDTVYFTIETNKNINFIVLVFNFISHTIELNNLQVLNFSSVQNRCDQ